MRALVLLCPFVCMLKQLKLLIISFLLVIPTIGTSLILYAQPLLALTFTPNLAKRDAPGPFSTGVMVQGNYDNTATSDRISFLEGNIISGNFSQNVDGVQGSIVFWITPEWDGNDGLIHILLYRKSNFRIEKNNIGQLRAYLSYGCNGSGINVDVSSWKAGDTHSVVFRWDTKNTLDDTNKYSISVDDQHTFSETNSLSPVGPSHVNIGEDSSIENPANALIEGLTIYRRPLYDGTYGVNVGNGDEIAKIYDSDENNGNGITPQDPTLVTGSWDVVFALPTDQSTGILTTTGQAWSHPHDLTSQKLSIPYFQTAFASQSNWVDEGTPLTPTSVEFDGTTSINAGSDTSLDNLHDGAFTVEGWVRLNPLSSSDDWIMAKGNSSSAGWYIRFDDVRGLHGVLFTDAGGMGASSGLDEFNKDNKWHHVAMTYDDAGDRTIRLWIDGLEVSSYYSVGTVNGTIVGDSTSDLHLGDNALFQNQWQGAISWTRISNTIRYSSTFTPPPRTSPPAPDENTVAQWNLDEGSGTAITNDGGATSCGGTPANCDGTLSNGTWNTVRDMSTESSGERIYPWGYAYGTDAANEGLYQDITVTPGDDWVIRALAHSDGTSIPKIILYDQTNGAEIGSLTGTNTSRKNNPDVFIFTGEAPTNDTTLRVKLINTQSSGVTYWHQVEVLPNLITNPSMETGSGNPWIPTGWTNGNVDSGESVQESLIVHSGQSSMEASTGWNNGENIYYLKNGTTSSGAFMNIGGWFYGNETSIVPNIKSNTLRFQYNNIELSLNSSELAEWHNISAIGRQTNSNSLFQNQPSGDLLGSIYYDDVYLFSLTPVSLTLTPASEANSTENTDELRVDGRDTYTASSAEATSIGTTTGFVSFNYRPRHAAADMVKFAETTGDDAYLINLQDATAGSSAGKHTGSNNAASLTDSTKAWTTNQWINYKVINLTDNSSATITANTSTVITATLVGGTDNDFDTNDVYVLASPNTIHLLWTAANTLRLAYCMDGTCSSGSWNATGSITANTEYPVTLSYTGGGSMILNVGGTDRITLSSIPASFSSAPNTVSFGSDSGGSNQGDATFSEIVFDNTAPDLTLDSLTTPTTDTTPTVTGTVTEAIGTVSSVEMVADDSVEGTWEACTAADSAFDEAEEDFSCTLSSPLADGAHTLYLRATDSNGNTTESGDEASVSLTLDTTAPSVPGTPTVNVSSPTNTTTQTWSWTGATDATTGILEYAWRVLNSLAQTVASGTTALTTAVTHLTQGTYTFLVKALDLVSNPSSEAASSSLVINTTAPLISLLHSDTALTDPAPNPPTARATITWTTTTPASSAVEYGEAVTYGATTTEADTNPRVTAHIVTLPSLSLCTVYHFRAMSTDAASNTTTSSDSAFTSAGCPSSPTPSPTPQSSGCSDTPPGSKAPFIYSASPQSPTSILLAFTPADLPFDHYALEYGTSPGGYQYGVLNLGGENSQTFVIDHLTPQTTYYFRLRSVNGCAPGSASNELSAATFSLFSLKETTLTTTLTPDQSPSPLNSLPNSSSCTSPYTVKQGDTLWSIAKTQLGKGSRYPEIVTQNQAAYPALLDNHTLTIGWSLILPCSQAPQPTASNQGLDQTKETNTDTTTPNQALDTPPNNSSPTPDSQNQNIPSQPPTPLLTHNLTVTVRDSHSQPIPNATVTLHSTPQTTTTDNQGKATFTNVENGDHTLTVAYDNYRGSQKLAVSETMSSEVAVGVAVKQISPLLTPPALLTITLLLTIIAFQQYLVWKKRKQ